MITKNAIGCFGNIASDFKSVYTRCIIVILSVAYVYFIKAFNPSWNKPPFKFSGDLTKLRLTPSVK